jgi:hypothetical protein
MSRLFKILFLTVGCNLFFTHGIHAGIVNNACKTIPGQWVGYINDNWGARCSYKGEFDGSLDDKIFTFTGYLNRTSSSDADNVQNKFIGSLAEYVMTVIFLEIIVAT